MKIFTLEKRQLLNLKSYAGKITCKEGKVWITQLGGEDIILENSDCEFKNSKELIIQSLGRSKVIIH
jgi:hypothetical protein